MAKKSPFITKEHMCPACNEKAEQRQFRTRVFLVVDKESDQHVLKYKWRDPNMEQVHPPFYFFFYCPYCHFTDTPEDYQDPGNSPYAPGVVKDFSRGAENNGAVLEALSDKINYKDIDMASAMKLHFLAIYEQLMTAPAKQHHYKIARMYLRVAWLYREQEGPKENETPADATEESSGESEAMAAVSKAFEGCEGRIHESLEQWDQVEEALVKSLPLGAASKNNPYAKHIAEARKAYDALDSKLLDLKTTFLEQSEPEALDNSAAERVEESKAVRLDSGHLKRLKIMWPQAPLSEKEAMRSAVRHFDKSLTTDRRFDSSEAYFRATSLVIDLMMRYSDLDGAFTMVRGMFRSCVDTRTELTEKLANKDIEPQSRQRLEVMLKRAGTALEQAGDLRRELMDHLVDREMPKVKKVLAKLANPSVRQIEKALESAGISKGLINHMKEPSQKHRVFRGAAK